MLWYEAVLAPQAHAQKILSRKNKTFPLSVGRQFSFKFHRVAAQHLLPQLHRVAAQHSSPSVPLLHRGAAQHPSPPDPPCRRQTLQLKQQYYKSPIQEQKIEQI